MEERDVPDQGRLEEAPVEPEGPIFHLTKGQGRQLRKLSRALPPPGWQTPWRLVEVFTWSANLSRQAAKMGWSAHEPVTLPGFDLSTRQGLLEAEEYLERLNPHVVMYAPPCAAWSPLQRLNVGTPEKEQRLEQKRKEQRPREPAALSSMGSAHHAVHDSWTGGGALRYVRFWESLARRASREEADPVDVLTRVRSCRSEVPLHGPSCSM